MKSTTIALIRLYQQAISPLLGPVCRYQPSCSNYAIEAITRFGTLRGGWLAAKRLSRCHPWHAGGYDPVPEATHRPSPDRISATISVYNLFHVKQSAKADSISKTPYDASTGPITTSAATSTAPANGPIPS